MTTESFDMTATLAPKSDQLNADDVLSAPRTVTITAVSRGTAEQPVNITTAEFGEGRPYKPCLSMRRVIAKAWGPDPVVYVGRRMTLFNDTSVKWGGVAVGGIRISHLSHIDKALSLPLTETRGKRKLYRVEPLPDGPPLIDEDTVADLLRAITEAATLDELETIRTDIKSWDLGGHKQALQTAWADRSKAIKQEGAEQ